MIYYVIKNTADVSQAQINASRARRTEGLRLSKSGAKCILKFEESFADYFMDEQWLTLDEARTELETPEWDHEASASFLDKALNLFAKA